MERNTPVRKPHTSTADLLTWSENPPADSPMTGSAARSSARSHQPSDGISKVVFGGQVTDEEVESLNKRKPVSGYKLKRDHRKWYICKQRRKWCRRNRFCNPHPI
ncbi:unnamed protein product [Lactuca virosa]|uniref:DUF4057 domain-containing protein n=1 Tax=Lactuca virosa TaxID=75947 RepID=A0AAU9PW24_9ASTR|nr:unnamed protein product [Lactuca virosa]